jgi:leucyl aminopeptidase
MTASPTLSVLPVDLAAAARFEGSVAVFVPKSGKLDTITRRINKLTKGALERLVAGPEFAKLDEGDALSLAYPVGMSSAVVQVIRLGRRAGVMAARKAGAAIGARLGTDGALVLCGSLSRADDIALGLGLRAYRYTEMQTAKTPVHGPVSFMVAQPEELTAKLDELKSLVEGVYFTRDLVNKPTNVLTTQTFADLLEENRALGLEIEVLEEADLEKLGMRLLLGVGLGSAMPTKVVIMKWNGGGDEKPLALIGKGVVFDTGGISIKPAGGMEDMTMDMGGAGVVSGVMKTLAMRKAKANVVGLVGLVENMPDGLAQRPGDVVASMKGDTVEIINTDAEGRLVLADVMWYAQERFAPCAMVDLATLTGAIIVALGHENAGVFSNDDALCNAFLKAAATEGEGAWRMPLGKGYQDLLKSPIADVKNIGGRFGGAITAAEFLHRFVKAGTPWIHLDIAGVAKPAGTIPLAPKGASGWGVLALDRLVRDKFEAKD